MANNKSLLKGQIEQNIARCYLYAPFVRDFVTIYEIYMWVMVNKDAYSTSFDWSSGRNGGFS
jgi:hypothetical protein